MGRKYLSASVFQYKPKRFSNVVEKNVSFLYSSFSESTPVMEDILTRANQTEVCGRYPQQ
jgi:hypothetical protein